MSVQDEPSWRKQSRKLCWPKTRTVTVCNRPGAINQVFCPAPNQSLHERTGVNVFISVCLFVCVTAALLVRPSICMPVAFPENVLKKDLIWFLGLQKSAYNCPVWTICQKRSGQQLLELLSLLELLRFLQRTLLREVTPPFHYYTSRKGTSCHDRISFSPWLSILYYPQSTYVKFEEEWTNHVFWGRLTKPQHLLNAVRFIHFITDLYLRDFVA